MIAKLCTYGANRNEALAHMIKALDSYVIKGVTHNIPLLREVLTHPRFVSGKISTKFLAEEFPKGFTGHPLTADEKHKLLALSGWIHAHRDIRNHCWIKEPVPYPNNWDLVVNIDKEKDGHEVKVTLGDEGDFTTVVSEKSSSVTADWPIESPLIRAFIDKDEMFSQYLEPLALGFKLSYMGTKYDMTVRTREQYQLSKYMKEKAHLDTSKLILSPMPGVVVSLSVKEGDVIAEGSEVAIVEAMKMQNVLRAHSAGKVKNVKVKQGNNVQANQILVELDDIKAK